MSISLYAEFSALDGKEELVSRLLAGFAGHVRAEPGNIVFDPFTLPGSVGRFFVVETYADQAAFETHLASAHGEAFNRALAPLIVGGRSTLTPLETVVSQR